MVVDPNSRFSRAVDGDVLDLRPAARFRSGHLIGSVSLPLEEHPDWCAGANLVSADLDAWLPSIYLPPRDHPLTVVASAPATAEAVCQLLAKRGRLAPTPVAIAPGRERNLPADVMETGDNRRHLWRPPRFLVDVRGWLPPPVCSPVLDLACGSGRAAVWLAERGYAVTGVDRDPDALGLARRLAASRGVDVQWRCGDLRHPGGLTTGTWSIVLMFRYWDRDLLAQVAGQMNEGGVIVVRTFRAALGYTGSPRPRHRVGAGELMAALPPDRFDHLVHDVGFATDGRPAVGLLARVILLRSASR